MSLRTSLCVLVLLALSTLAGAAMPQPMSPAPASPAKIAAALNLTGVPSWLPAGTGAAKKPGANSLFTPNCASVCWQIAHECVAGCDGDELCQSNCSYDFNCCNQACYPDGPQCY
ncbi:MAG TPA: hypothetical protein VFE33_03050 [Thermoanaerobaculia bacterium]|nr:hypothetical protein [Thermoanaerobaculia bacterium]